MSSRLKKIYTFVALLMCFALVFGSINVAYASVLVKDYFRHVEEYAEGYDEYLFAISYTPWNTNYIEKDAYYTFYVPVGERVALMDWGQGTYYQVTSQSGKFVCYCKGVYFTSSGVDSVYDEYGNTYTSINVSHNERSNILYNPFYIFNNVDELEEYLQTGDTEGAIASPTKSYNSDEFYLNNFRVIYHDSNNFDNCYLEVKYDVSDYLKGNEEAELIINYEYNCDLDFLGDAHDGDTGLDYAGNMNIFLSAYGDGFNLYLKDLFPQDDYSSARKQTMLGDEAIIDFNKWGLDFVAEVVISRLYISFVPYCDNTFGLQYDAQVDLLNPSNTTYHSSTPDENGNYTTNNDYTQGDGYYTTIVGTDGQGNPTYNYYYYDNSTHTTITLDPTFDTDTDVDVGVGGDSIPEGSDVLTILWGNALTVNGSLGGSGSGGTGGSGGDVTINGCGDNIDITIEDDDYTDSSLREDLRDGFGLLDNMQTDESSDGFLQLSARFYEHLDGELDDMLVFGMASVVVICILRSALRR